MHDRTHERGALIGRKDRDRVDVQADEEEESPRRQCTLVLRQDVSGRRCTAWQFGGRTASFAFTRRSGSAIFAKTTLTKSADPPFGQKVAADRPVDRLISASPSRQGAGSCDFSHCGPSNLKVGRSQCIGRSPRPLIIEQSRLPPTSLPTNNNARPTAGALSRDCTLSPLISRPNPLISGKFVVSCDLQNDLLIY